MTLDPLILSRLQWAWVIGWHILLPAFTVGMASYIAVLEGLHFFSRNEVWLRISLFWARIFAIAFGMGVVTGIVMPFQFGTNWSRFSDATANVLSPMLAYEDLMAFFLEASFLGVLLFGRRLVPRWAHFLSACMVALGTLMSSFWILAANSWMQTPAGYEVRDGRFFPVDWLAIVFNPSFPYRLAHNVTAFYITTGFVVLGVGATLVRRGTSIVEAQRMMLMALGFLAVFVPLQIFLGEAQRRDGTVDRGGSAPTLALVHLKPANILSRCGIGRSPQEGCEAAHETNILALRIGSQAAHRHVFEHALPQRTDGAVDRWNGHRKFLSC